MPRPPPRPGSLAPNLGDHGPSDSALAAASDWRLRQPAADRHAARCASRDLCSGARHSAPCALGRASPFRGNDENSQSIILNKQHETRNSEAPPVRSPTISLALTDTQKNDANTE